MPASACHLRCYGTSSDVDRHDFAQWVLPLRGDLDVEVDAFGGRLDVLQGAFVAPGEGHAQTGDGDHLMLIVDCPAGVIDDDTLDHLRRQRWLALPKGLRQRLTGAAEHANHDLLAVLLQQYAPAGSAARLHALCTRLTANPGADWNVARMAALVGISGSRLHAAFVQEFGVPPQAWLSACRLRWAKRRLLTSTDSIATIALDAGYSEHSALSRALRRETGLTPQAFRRQ
ncbi:helix-turn-helix domain-containing protein [Stenotrophomonas sp. JAG2]|uniref:helix-turn-helix domain-containing protein n=1 Tax=Stenotrophomonas sp. JAG2 TaxID=3229243 RepID=UPI0034E25930